MPWVTPTNFVTATVVTEAMMDNLSDNLSTGVVRPIAEVNTGSPVATVDFASIPATFRSLMLVMLARGDTGSATADVFARINNSVAAGSYHSQALYSSGSTPSAFEVVGSTAGIWVGTIPAAGSGSSIMYGASQILALDYLNTSAMKVFRTVNMSRYGAAGTMRLMHIGGTWDSSTALNQITLFCGVGNFFQNSRFTLLGVPYI